MPLTKPHPRMFDCSVDHLFNAKDYGAVGDGIADDTLAIKAAIAAAGIAGGTVYAPADRYLLSSTVTLDKPNVYVKGDGMYITTFTRTADYGNTFLVTENIATGDVLAHI